MFAGKEEKGLEEQWVEDGCGGWEYDREYGGKAVSMGKMGCRDDDN